MSNSSNEDSLNENENWYRNIIEEEDNNWEDKEDFRYIKLHPVLVNIIEFVLLMPMRIIVVGVLLLFSFIC